MDSTRLKWFRERTFRFPSVNFPSAEWAPSPATAFPRRVFFEIIESLAENLHPNVKNLGGKQNDRNSE